MDKFLVLSLESQIASFGDLAGYDRRKSDSWPAKSALIGLLGGALGIRRDDDQGQHEIGLFSFAVAMFDCGTSLRDFHTAQAVHQKVKRPATRAIALKKGRDQSALNTVLSQRDYRVGVSCGVAIWGGKLELKEIANALARPVFTLYLGRKSCPLSSPMWPTLVDAEDPIAALNHVHLPPWREKNLEGRNPSPLFYISDPYAGLDPDKVESRFDIPVNRSTWTFRGREVHYIGGA